MAYILYVTVPIELESLPTGFDRDLVCDKFTAYRDGTLVPLLELKTSPDQNGDVFSHWHESTRHDACNTCIEIAQDGRN